MKIVIADCYYENFDQEKKIFKELGSDFWKYDCKTEEEVISVASDCDALICQFAPITRRVIEALKNCKVIVRYAIGYDNIDWKAAAEYGIYVCNCPDYCIDEVSNHAVSLLMDCVRKLTYMAEQTKLGSNKYSVVKPLLRTEGKTLGLVGFGRIASAVARKMGGFNLKIIAFDPLVDPARIQAAGVASVDFDTLLKESDFISVHCPLNENSRHLFDKDAFSKMKQTAILVNTSRGAVVDEAALIDALTNHKIGMAGIDVTESEPVSPDNPLLHLPNAVVTPHIAWYSMDSGIELQLKVAQEVERVLRGGKPLHPVNKPVETGR